MMKYNEKGITLIALVITVIVLLILASVAINAIVGGEGLFSKTKEAADKYNNSAKDEADLINDLMASIGSNKEKLAPNTPELLGNMKKVSWNTENEEIVPSTDEEWYDYSSGKWANAKSTDGSYWVWVPRYEYKVISGQGTSESGKIDISFIPKEKVVASEGYKIHPSFTNGTDNNYSNGEWDKEISGFWISKFEAGFQASSIDTNGDLINASETIVNSNINYTLSPGVTAIGNLTTSSKISYPVFKPQTYAFNQTNPGDVYNICREISSATSFYGLAGMDSHLMKNSEWGAVAYLTQSDYGRNGVEPNINNLNLNNKDTKFIFSVTGFGGISSKESSGGLDIVDGYKEPNGLKASSTGNIFGIYDLNGGTRELTTAYIANNSSSLKTYADSYTYTGTVMNTSSTKYATIYPYKTDNDTATENATNFKNNFRDTRYGDAIIETSALDGTASGWNGDKTEYPNADKPLFLRGGIYSNKENAGLFCFNNPSGFPNVSIGFRCVLIGNN